MEGYNPKIGLDNVVIAEVISDDSSGITYGEVRELKGAVNATINPNSEVATDFGDNGVIIAMNSRGNTEIAFEMTGIDPDVRAFMLGQRKVNGVTIETAMDAAPYVAMGFRIWIAGTDTDGGKIYKNVWLAKGKFSVPEDGAETKKESINFQHENMTGQFVSTIFIPNGQDSGTIMSSMRTDDPTVPSALKSGWFNAPVISTAVDTGKLTVTAAAGSNNTVVFTGAKVGGGSFVFSQPSLKLGDSVLVFDSNGVLIAGTLEASATASAAPTFTFTPTDAEDVPDAVSVTSGVKDSFGVSATPMTDVSL